MINVLLLVLAVPFLSGHAASIGRHIAAVSRVRASGDDQRSYYGVTDPALLRTIAIPVQEIWRASQRFPGFQDVIKDEDQEEINQWNDADTAEWAGQALTMDALWQMPNHKLGWDDRWDTKRLVAIRNNTVYFLRQDLPPYRQSVVSVSPAAPVNVEMTEWLHNMKALTQKMRFPDVVFFFSVFDWPSCCPGDDLPCPVPVLSYQKRAGCKDILVPRLYEVASPLYIFDWKHKVDKVFMRATPFCQGGTPQRFVKCARSYFAQLDEYRNMSHILEAGLTKGYGFKNETDKVVLADGPLKARGFFPLRDHARYRYLLDTDGMTGSYRAAKLMHFNSPIFKQDSPWFEWYGRSLQEGVHHIKFWTVSKDDIFDIVEKHRRDSSHCHSQISPCRHNETALQQMTHRAMRFAYKYTSLQARALYLKRALVKYKALFGTQMDEWMAKFDWQAATA